MPHPSITQTFPPFWYLVTFHTFITLHSSGCDSYLRDNHLYTTHTPQDTNQTKFQSVNQACSKSPWVFTVDLCTYVFITPEKCIHLLRRKKEVKPFFVITHREMLCFSCVSCIFPYKIPFLAFVRDDIRR